MVTMTYPNHASKWLSLLIVIITTIHHATKSWLRLPIVIHHGYPHFWSCWQHLMLQCLDASFFIRLICAFLAVAFAGRAPVVTRGRQPPQLIHGLFGAREETPNMWKWKWIYIIFTHKHESICRYMSGKMYGCPFEKGRQSTLTYLEDWLNRLGASNHEPRGRSWLVTMVTKGYQAWRIQECHVNGPAISQGSFGSTSTYPTNKF